MSVQEIGIAPSFRVGQVISTSISIWARNLIFFSVLGLVANLPGLFIKLYVFEQASGGTPPSLILNSLGSVSDVICGQILAAVITFGVFQQLRGRPVSFNACVSAGFARFLPVIGTSLIAGLMIGIAALALVIPGIIVMMMFWVAIPACVAENLGVSDSLGRSAGLTKGYRWQVLGIVLILTVLSVALGAIVGFVFGLGIAIAHTGSIGLVIALYLVTSLIAAFQAVCATTGYYYLRVAKEGVDIDQIAAVFD
jgi:hypothetical protein